MSESKFALPVALFSQIHRQIKIDYVGAQFITLAARGDNRKGAACA
jgi:hypothetical protein